jgi:hypothetical protein
MTNTLDVDIDALRRELAEKQAQYRNVARDFPLIEADAIEAQRQHRQLLASIKRRALNPEIEAQLIEQNRVVFAGFEARIALAERVENKLHALKLQIADLRRRIPPMNAAEALHA